ncbi:MAG: hypothetical protein MJ179_04400 [Treponema sp.]|nr:hypothetical protein [Treponema sp.]
MEEEKELQEKTALETKKTETTKTTENAESSKNKDTEQKLKDFISKASEFSAHVIKDVSAAVKKTSDKGVIKISIQNLKSGREKKYAEMGQKLSKLLMQKGSSLKNLESISETQENADLLQQIEECQKNIVKINKDISKLEKNLEELK